MPQRFLRPGLTTSDRWNSVSWPAQSLYIRLLTLVDDFGRYDGRPAVLFGHCFALRSDVTIDDTRVLRDELHHAKLIEVYLCEDGKEYVQVLKWEERTRAQASKYPEPFTILPTSDNNCQQKDASLVPRPSPSPSIYSRSANAESTSERMDAVVSAWNDLPEPFQKIRRMSAPRRQALKTRLADAFWREHWQEAISLIPSRPFLSGMNDRGWIATFDFFLKPESVTKILEGQYSNAPKNGTHQPATSARTAGTVNNPADYRDAGKLPSPDDGKPSIFDELRNGIRGLPNPQ